MILSHYGDIENPYFFARIRGIFHVNLLFNPCSESQSNSLVRENSIVKTRMDFVLVQWYAPSPERRRRKAGWSGRRLPRFHLIDSSDPLAYGFLDPDHIIRAVHMLPAFAVNNDLEWEVQAENDSAESGSEPDIDIIDEGGSDTRGSEYYLNWFVSFPSQMAVRSCN
jgi:hypothetical protein